ncbi:MAG: GNAT family N-acetyltransferase, partial [bacterium]|nr:GNAT family N-acetyltransferase [bacterium]
KGYGFINNHTPEIAMAVKKDFRNIGLGTKLLLTLMNKIKSDGYSAVSLSVDKRNRAVNLYKRVGFAIVEDPENDFIMTKQL